jgi:hypothetical protein
MDTLDSSKVSEKAIAEIEETADKLDVEDGNGKNKFDFFENLFQSIQFRHHYGLWYLRKHCI